MAHLSQIELSRDALLHNVRTLRGVNPDAGTLAVVKANAYGHGLERVVPILEGEVGGFQVDDIEELRNLRRVSNAPASVFGYVREADLEEALKSRPVTLGVYDAERLPALDRICGRLYGGDEGFVKDPMDRGGVEIKVDALLGRQGILPADIDALLDALDRCRNLEPVAVYAHYANIEDTTDLTHAEAQEEAFEEAYRKVRRRWPEIVRHLSATSGLLTRPASLSQVVRLGIGLYGLYPSASLARSHTHLDLRPVMRWVTHLAQVKTLPAGHPVGYGLTYRTARPTRVGIVPQGYSDGFDRGLSNVGEVLVHGRRCPVVGRIAMNMFAVDLTPAPDARAEDEVVLLGAQGEDRIAAEEIAARLGTINYEIVARVSPLLPRVVV